jgi:hypothetical protein
MGFTKKIWEVHEAEPPDGVLHQLKTAPPHWFHEDPAYAAELYGLELYSQRTSTDSFRGMNQYIIHVIDDEDTKFVFTVKVGVEIVARVIEEGAPGRT